MLRTMRFAALAFAASWLIYPGFGLIDLYVSWNPAWAVALEAGWGLMFTVLVAIPLLWFAARPRRAAAALVQLLGAAAALALSAVASLEWPLLLVALAVAAQSLVVAYARPELGGLAVSRPLAILAAVAAPAWLVYANAMYAENRRNWPDDVSVGIDHDSVQGALALALVLLSAAAALWPRGRRFIGLSAGAAAAYLALVCLFGPATPADIAAPWSVAALVWAAAFAALSFLGQRRQPIDRPEQLVGGGG